MKIIFILFYLFISFHFILFNFALGSMSVLDKLQGLEYRNN